MADANNNLEPVIIKPNLAPINANLAPRRIRRRTHFECVNCRSVPQEYGVRCGNCNGNSFYLGIDQSKIFRTE